MYFVKILIKLPNCVCSCWKTRQHKRVPSMPRTLLARLHLACLKQKHLRGGQLQWRTDTSINPTTLLLSLNCPLLSLSGSIGNLWLLSLLLLFHSAAPSSARSTMAELAATMAMQKPGGIKHLSPEIIWHILYLLQEDGLSSASCAAISSVWQHAVESRSFARIRLKTTSAVMEFRDAFATATHRRAYLRTL